MSLLKYQSVGQDGNREINRGFMVLASEYYWAIQRIYKSTSNHCSFELTFPLSLQIILLQIIRQIWKNAKNCSTKLSFCNYA